MQGNYLNVRESGNKELMEDVGYIQFIHIYKHRYFISISLLSKLDGRITSQ